MTKQQQTSESGVFDITKGVIPIVVAVAILASIVGPLIYISRKAYEWDTKIDTVARELSMLNGQLVGRGQFKEWLYLTRAANPSITLPNLPPRTSEE